MGILNHRTVSIMKKEVKQLRRDRRSFGIILFLPVFMLFTFGYALTFDVSHVRLSVYDQDRTPYSRELISKFTNTEYFDFVGQINNQSDINDMLDTRSAVVVLVIPSDFSKKLLRGEKVAVQLLLDGSNSNEATTIQSYLQLISQSYSSTFQVKYFERNGQKKLQPLDIQPRIFYNPELKSSRYLIPGLIVYIMMITAVISTSVSIVREKERKTMEQLMVSPVKPIELILGKTIPYLILSLILTYFILLMSYLLFDEPVAGNHLMLFLVIFIFLLGGLGLGILISSLVDNQAMAFMAATFISVLPTIILSGFVFPLDSMSLPLQYLSMILPGRYFLSMLRELIIKGSGIESYWKELLGLSFYTILMIQISKMRIKKIIGG